MVDNFFKSTQQMLHDVWEYYEETDNIPRKKLPPAWTEQRDITIDDVVIWECLFYEPGNVGVYVSWSPYAEFYAIVYALFSNTDVGIKTFYGKDAYAEVLSELKKLDIELPVNTVYTNS